MISDRDRDGLGYAIGASAEEFFKHVMNKRGWYVEDATKEQNIYEHWDFRLYKDHWSFTVDVKAQKRVSRGDTDTTPQYVWLELRNNAGFPGWLYKTEANYLAFQREDVFYLVAPRDLRDVVTRLVDDEMVRYPKDALYKVYSREGRDDLLTMIKYKDLPIRTIVS